MKIRKTVILEEADRGGVNVHPMLFAGGFMDRRMEEPALTQQFSRVRGTAAAKMENAFPAARFDNKLDPILDLAMHRCGPRLQRS